MLTIYAPYNNKKSKAWEVFNGIEHSWPEQVKILDNGVTAEPLANSMYWGFVNNNMQMIKQLEKRKHPFWFTDTPYFGRFDNNNLKPDNHYWRISKNKIHASYIKGCKADRFEKFGLKIKAIKIREKPRGRGTSGPSEAKVPLSEDLKDAWCLVTSCSIAAVEAQCMGIPVICDEKSFAKEVGGQELSDIENPFFVGCEEWLYSLAYQQFTPEEFSNGKAVEIMMGTGVL